MIVFFAYLTRTPQEAIAYGVKLEVVQGSVDARLTLLQVGCPHCLEVVGIREGDGRDLRGIENRIKSQRIRGSWYILRPEQVAEIVAEAPLPNPTTQTKLPEHTSQNQRQTSLYVFDGDLDRAERLVPLVQQQLRTLLIGGAVNRSTVLRMAVNKGLALIEKEFDL